MHADIAADENAGNKKEIPGLFEPVVLFYIGHSGVGHADGAQVAETARYAKGLADKEQQERHGQADQGAANIPGPGFGEQIHGSVLAIVYATLRHTVKTCYFCGRPGFILQGALNP